MKLDSRIYVAGHKGLVGSAIVKSLKKKGYTNFIGRTHSEADLIDQQVVASIFDEEKPEYVFLAAAKVGGIVANNKYRADFIYQNLMIQSNVIHQSYLHKIKKLLFLGSTCIYPRNSPQPMPEDCLLTGPLEYTNEPYAIAKIAGIKMCESYNLQYGTNFISVMPTNLYGPNDTFDLEKSHVLPALIRKLHLGKALKDADWIAIKMDLNKLPIEGVDGASPKSEILSILSKYGVTTDEAGNVQVEIWGTGKPTREFLWSEDMADACVFLMENTSFEDLYSIDFPGGEGLTSYEKHNKEIQNTHVNLGTGVELSIRELVETVKTVIGYDGKLFFNADKPDGMMKKLTNVSKVHALGWKHTVELGDGIQRMYDWYVSQRQ